MERCPEFGASCNGSRWCLSECIKTLNLEPHTNHNHLYELNLFKGDLMHLCGKCIEQYEESSIHPNPLFLVLNLTQMQKNWLHIPFLFAGKIYQSLRKKTQKFFTTFVLGF